VHHDTCAELRELIGASFPVIWRLSFHSGRECAASDQALEIATCFDVPEFMTKLLAFVRNWDFTDMQLLATICLDHHLCDTLVVIADALKTRFDARPSFSGKHDARSQNGLKPAAVRSDKGRIAITLREVAIIARYYVGEDWSNIIIDRYRIVDSNDDARDEASIRELVRIHPGNIFVIERILALIQLPPADGDSVSLRSMQDQRVRAHIAKYIARTCSSASDAIMT
jgi:hypothetical protein